MRLDRETLDPWWQQDITTEAATMMTMTVIDVSMGPPNKTKLQLFGFSFQLAGQILNGKQMKKPKQWLPKIFKQLLADRFILIVSGNK